MAILNIFQSLSLSSIILSVTVLGSLAFCLTFLSRRPSFPKNAPPLFRGGYPILGAYQFFTRRWDFFRHASAASPSGNFSYYIGQHAVVGLSGDDSRKAFFENRGLGFAEGYAVLFNMSPKVDTEKEEDMVSGSYFSSRITRMLRKENFVRGLPQLIKDTRARLDALAADPSGITDPFESIYKIVYQLTMRTVGANEIADDPVLLNKTLSLFETIEHSSQPSTIIFPWLASPAMIRRYIAGGKLYMVFKSIVDDRKRTGRREDDALQYLIDQGDSVNQIIGFVLGALFAGQLNSGINACYVLCYLAQNPHWLSEARKEITAAGAKHSTNPDQPLVEQLASLSLEAWETEFPLLDMCLRDSIRLQLLGTAFRRNVSGHAIKIGTEVIPNGAFATYHLDDVHQDPAIYPDPETWDPSRYMPHRAEDKKKPHAFVGWGSSIHVCLGMRFAKLEQNIIVAFFVAMFDFEVTDREGRSMKLPKTDRNGHAASKPSKPVYLKYRVREKSGA
ncbi:hypothetical protein W97_08049 [Coniosporium apollinis CBS 100218]|uniref:Cytochrome P450 6A1 n=1 Tax=Coniosporium apollinis (strain CBS 100218) TaxID=1168221 RepID=R7Z4D7_CONA1|nr:uncharacterized protein W97_08049 [Coniosporium apollinis CBS 100218]EON68791.1 hypothetical protein W97_08049 [Coniosporium apollinis CBS 100218]